MRKITTLKVFSIIMIVGLVFSCASTSNNSPEWILSPTSVYSDEEYLSAVGYGADRASAENAAIAAITKTIKQNVKSTTLSTEKFSQTDKGWDNAKDYSNNVETYSDLVISGIYIQDVYPVKKGKTTEYYALALVNRTEAGNHGTRCR